MCPTSKIPPVSLSEELKKNSLVTPTRYQKVKEEKLYSDEQFAASKNTATGGRQK